MSAPIAANAAALPRRLAVAWGSGSFCQTLVIYAFGVLYFRYLTDTVGLGAALVGSLIAVSKVYDALINPVIGWLSDRIDTPMGRRRPWMLAGAVLMALAMAGGFAIPPQAAPGLRMVWAGAGLFLFSSGYSLFAIPWLAMPQEVAAIPHERTQMMAWRVGFSSLATGAAAVCGPMLLSAMGSGAPAYRAMGLLMGGLGLAAALGSILALRSAPQRAIDTAPPAPLVEGLRAIASNRSFAILVAIKVCIYFALGFNAAAMALLTRWVLHVADYWLGLYTTISTLALLLSQPLWLWLARRHGKTGALAAAMACHGAALLSLAANHGSAAMLLAQAVALGAGGGGIFMLSQALLPDVIEQDNAATGMRRGGAFAGIVAFLETGASALA
ncbi:MAG TPA: MFS transporter, partial [Novosphingobium sp.]|nr:MFS transporter [Novosphingobium sp.]